MRSLTRLAVETASFAEPHRLPWSRRMVSKKMWCRCHVLGSSGNISGIDLPLNAGFSRENALSPVIADHKILPAE